MRAVIRRPGREHGRLLAMLAGALLLHVVISGVGDRWGERLEDQIRMAGSGLMAVAMLGAFLWLRAQGVRLLILLGLSAYFLWDAATHWKALG